MKKEAIAHGVWEDLANRNDNWDKLDGVINQVTELDEGRQTLKNEIVNGDFSDGTVGWTSESSTSVANDNILTNTANGTSVYGRINQFNVDSKPLKDEKIYYTYKIKPLNTNVNTSRILLRNGTSSPLYERPHVDGLVNGQINTVSGIQIIGADFLLGLRVYLTHHYVSAEIANGKSVEFSEVSIINLTQVFGAGNEPTKKEMDVIMDTIGYFNGTHTITSKEQFNILLKMVRENALATTSLGGGF